MANTIQYRVCTAGDIPQLRQLWQLCFGDSDAFLEFYFAQRFVPNLSVCTEADGVIVGAIFGLPCQMSMRNLGVSASMSSGFCTHPDHRGKGYFSNLYRLYLQVLRENHVLLAPNTPVYHDSYFRFETRTVSQSKYLEGIATQGDLVCQEGGDLGQMWACYHRFSQRYSGILCRSYRDFLLKIADCQADGGHILSVTDGETVTGYALYYLTGEKLTAFEVVAETTQAEVDLLTSLAAVSKGLPMAVKLPPDSQATWWGLMSTTEPQGVCSVTDVSKLLHLVGKELDVTVEVCDPAIPQNNGIFDFSGRISRKIPDISLSSGYLLQALVGYTTFGKLVEDGHATCQNQAILSRLDATFPATTCFVADEY